MKKYWVVYNPQTEKFQNYSSRLEAEDAAKALATANPTYEFVIFEALASVKQPSAPKEEVTMTDKERVDSLLEHIKQLEADLDFAEQARDLAQDKANKAEDKLEAIKQAVGD